MLLPPRLPLLLGGARSVNSPPTPLPLPHAPPLPPRMPRSNDEGSPALIAVVECRGCEPEPASFDGQAFTATSSGGTELEGVMEDGEWADYDDDTDVNMALMEVKTAWAICPAPGKGKGRRRA